MFVYTQRNYRSFLLFFFLKFYLERLLSLQSIRHALHNYFLPLAKIEDLYTANVNEIVNEFVNVARSQNPQDDASDAKNKSITLIRDPEYRRLKATIDMPLAVKLYNVYR